MSIFGKKQNSTAEHECYVCDSCNGIFPMPVYLQINTSKDAVYICEDCSGKFVDKDKLEASASKGYWE